VTVTQVLDLGDATTNRWTFSSACTSLSDGSGLETNGNAPATTTLNGDGTIDATYTLGSFPGLNWDTAVPPFAGTFASGGTLANGQSGTIT
jgi:hypothetical protein